MKHYSSIKDVLMILKPCGYRADLIYQGEGDSGGGTTQESYPTSLTYVSLPDYLLNVGVLIEKM